MKSQLNFKVRKDDQEYDMHALGIWVSSFHIYSPNVMRSKTSVPGMPGAHLRDTQDGERTVYTAMQIEAYNISDFYDLKHRVFNLFYSKEEITIVRHLTTDKEIRVLQEGSYDINNLSLEDGEFELFLTMVDPFVYGKEIKRFDISYMTAIESFIIKIQYRGC
ncbi:phage tail domain-containing protein [Ornithinibacillus californiensis]|uniref:phage tail domain-containing protein n=1 Tax=Ornithinibacillus californiensis TaxID=161536 RepID=UPI00064D8787|nr:phage tail domain-containing protein [Ornithinibacillus californiensis]